ncbi:YnfA family protein [Alkanindiges sp. WGS2144]|uniref:YnfA family protein n=1 Tax=Alkanindiges sp. WGS2144 TaxID=3366808 RepID=UPI00374FEDAD
MFILKAFGLFALTALAEIIGCYLPYLVLKQAKPAWLLIPAVLSLIGFVWLLTLHPAAAGRVYAAYGGVYMATALLWLYFIDGLSLTPWDMAGALIIVMGAGVIILQPGFSQ